MLDENDIVLIKEIQADRFILEKLRAKERSKPNPYRAKGYISSLTEEINAISDKELARKFGLQSEDQLAKAMGAS